MPLNDDLDAERDLQDPANWGNMVEQSLADVDLPAPPADEDDRVPATPATPAAPADTSALTTQLAEEQARRIQLQLQLEQLRSTPAPQPQAPQGQPPMTEQELRQLHDEDPVRASAVLASRIADARVQNLDARMSTMLAASAAVVEAQVASRFADDFADYGDEIRQVMQQVSPEHRIEPGSWEQAIRLVRGAHLDEIIEKRTKAATAKLAEEARQVQSRSAGFSGTGRASAPTSGGSARGDQFFGLSEAQRRAADSIGVSYKDFAKHV